MSKELRHIISNLLAESSHFNANDVLVNAHDDHFKLFFSDGLGAFSMDEFPKRILSDARANMKESGVNTLCVAHGMMQLELNGKQVESPILLTPLTAIVDRIQQTVRFVEVEDSSFVNPFIVGHFRKKFDVNIPTELRESSELDRLVDFFASKELPADASKSVIGNFHHHRYQVLKELEELQSVDNLNPAISALFGEESTPLSELDFSSSNLFPADTDHEAVFRAVEKSHVVVQGPPGTGKSQVICNLIGKALSTNETILAVSEKYSALAVIESKLSEFDLNLLSFVAGSDRQSHDFLESLKTTWDFFESYQPSTEINLRLSEQYEDHLQMTLNMLKQDDLIGGVSFHEFMDLSHGKNLDTAYSSKVSTIKQLIEQKAIIERVFALELHDVLCFLRKKTLESDTFLAFDQQIEEWKNTLSLLSGFIDLATFDELSSAMKKAAVCQIFENELFKKYSAVFTPNSKEQKQFYRLEKQYDSLSVESKIGTEWKIYPSIVEAKSLLNQVQNGSFLERRAAKKRWKQLSTLPYSEAQSLLNIRQDLGEEEVKLEKCLSQLRRLGITDPTKEITQIKESIAVFTEERWLVYASIPVAHRAEITLHHKTLSDFHHDLISTFKITGHLDLPSFFTSLKSKLPFLLAERKNILLLDQSELESLQGCADFSAYETAVFGSNYTAFKERFPAFSTFEPSEIREKVKSILNAQASESRIHANHLLDAVHDRFAEFHTLLNTPANRLTSSEKALKKELKKGKSILIKEFGKTRSHPTLRELFQSEARHWISLLKPIWLSNPSSLANCFPMEQNCFDLVIFDEASQIPIQHALGAIQRSKRVVVAGDEHQMGPSTYFQSGSNEISDLLHQASYYFPKVPLLHHYRSAHPDLIAFSNKHFYDGKLTAYPSAQLIERPIAHHFIENGQFIERTNEEEAKAIAVRITNKIRETKSIGIVAFSEEQLACIWKQLDSVTQNKLLEHQETNGGFFKALENVQGDECDCLLIGFGYAANETGDFHMRFGPMNTENGRKRLNVLLTRARESIDFFCSVQSSDFKLSDNESINLLRQWVAFSERNEQSNQVIFPHGLTPTVNGNSLDFSRIQTVLASAREIATLHSVLENRGWKVIYS